MTLSFGLTFGNNTGFLYATLSYSDSYSVSGWVCDDWFDEVEAMAICNSMNGSYWFFGHSQDLTDEFDDFILDDFRCSGIDNISSQCSWTYEHNCWGGEGLYLDCAGQRDWNPGPVYFNLSDGDHGILHTTSFTYTGQLAVGYICANYFDTIEAKAICTYMFGANSYWTYFNPNYVEDQSLEHFDTGISCSDHTDLWTNCTFYTNTYCYEHYVYLDCRGEPVPPEAPNTANGSNLQSFGLTNGTSGILYMRDGWVCDDLFDKYSASIVCAEMGMGRSSVYMTADITLTSDWSRFFSPNDFGMDDLVCPNDAKVIEDCRWRYTHDCSYTKGIWMSCTNTTGNDSSSGSSVVATVFFTLGIILVIILSSCWFLMKRRPKSGMNYFNVMPSTTVETNADVIPVAIVKSSESKLQREVVQLKAEIAKIKAGGRRSEQNSTDL